MNILNGIRKHLKFGFGIVLGLSMVFLFGTMDGADAGVVPELPMEIYIGWGALTLIGGISLIKWNESENEVMFLKEYNYRLLRQNEIALIELCKQEQMLNKKKIYDQEKE